MSEPPAQAGFVGRVAALARGLRELTGWRGRGVAFAVGAVATLALPAVYFLPALYLSFPVLLWMLAGRRGRKAAFGLGWWFGFGYFGLSLYWIGNALLVFAAQHAWLLPFAALGLPAFLAFFIGFATLAASFVQGPAARAIALAAAWGAVEWLRGHVLTGFPWNLVGNGWAGSDALIQSAAVLGIYGVSLIAVLSACLPAALLAGPRRMRIGLAAVSIALIAVPWVAGQVRLAAAPPVGSSTVEGIGLRLVQAAVPQREKWRRDLRGRNLRQYLALSTADRPDWITHIIWPENAATFFLADDAPVRLALAKAVPPGGLLITGAPRRERQPLRIWNSVFAIDERAAVAGWYDKFHLVPFGEYAPFRDYLPVEKIAHGMVDYSVGPGPTTLRLPGLPPVSPLICYEVIFPGAVTDPDDPPAWLLNLTNDAWYGKTAGPHQHLAITRVRAVEEGLPLVRVASTGISAVIDPFGRIAGRIPLGTAGVLDSRLPKALAARTWYSRYGDLPFFLLLACLAGLAVAFQPRNARQRASDSERR